MPDPKKPPEEEFGVPSESELDARSEVDRRIIDRQHMNESSLIGYYAQAITASFLRGGPKEGEEWPESEEEWLDYEHPDKDRMEGQIRTMLRGMAADMMKAILKGAAGTAVNRGMIGYERYKKR